MLEYGICKEYLRFVDSNCQIYLTVIFRFVDSNSEYIWYSKSFENYNEYIYKSQALGPHVNREMF